MNFKCELIEQSEEPVLSIRTRTAVGNLSQEFGKSMGAIMQYLGEIGETADGAPFSAYYNEDMANLDVEIGIPVAKPVAGKGAIKANKILTGKGVSCIYKGPYSQVGPVYQSMMAWINQKGLIPNGICYEFYFNSPLEVPEKELLTKIVFLLK